MSSPIQFSSYNLASVSEASLKQSIFRKPLSIKMRDGKCLAADLYSTNTALQKPVILIQTPYNKKHYWTNLENSVPFSVQEFNIVALDWRGRFESKKAAVKKSDIGKDGYDAVEWIARQSWCNGRIGTYGSSALAQVQFKTASENPPHLVCAIPMVKDFRVTYNSYFYGGEYRKEHVTALESLQFLDQSAILSHPTYNSLWKYLEKTSDLSSSVQVPMLMIGGWFDHFPDLVLRAFSDLQKNSYTKVRSKHKLIYGPWLHGEVGSLEQGCLTFPNAENFAQEKALKFMRFYLLDHQNNWEKESPIQYYQMGTEEWLSTDHWESTPRKSVDYYFHPDLSLAKKEPPGESFYAAYTYNPNDPTPSHGGNRFQPFNKKIIIGPQDQSKTIETRNDVLLYTSDAFTEPFAINGSIETTLYIQSNRPDADFCIRFCDVYPDGKSILLAEGIQRARFHNSLEQEDFLKPNQIYKISVHLQNIAQTILPNHKIRIIVSSSSYPIFEKNLNNGGPLYNDTKVFIAENRIYSYKQYPSKVTFQTLD